MRKTFSLLLVSAPLVLLASCKCPFSGSSPTDGGTATDAAQAVTRIDPDTGFATGAFPPTLSDTEWHQDAWNTLDCLTCHEDGIADAPVVRHRGLPARLVTAQCRSCHVLIPGQTEDEVVVRED
ncbi:MAG: hypothetical protein H7A45_04540 [Verrucomicrobiales bacterium]|nr:hypothetical protein [Verrucomicrobiales bacterium]MCP5527640.1 hypothetical protein [Verrucomicrobiales bacterium]